MKVKIYAFFDVKTQAFLNYWNAHTEAEAFRIAKNLANDSETVFGKNPEDYQLFYLGTFDTTSDNPLVGEPSQHVTTLNFLVDNNE